MLKILQRKITSSIALTAVLGLGGLVLSPQTLAVDLAQSPLFLSQPAKPIVMLAMTVDHELFKKAYNDYSNLDGGILTMDDVTYRNDFRYYGYFDSDWCYTYMPAATVANSRFFPHSLATNHVCSATGASTTAGAWSGNFLNWATMARIDIVRQVLYGGMRSVDTTTRTVLERAYLPKDIHAFVKVYEGATGDFTPYTGAISLCNVSTGNNGYPTVRIASGSWRQWSAGEVDQCRWRSERNYNTNPQLSSELGTLTVKVEVCRQDSDGPTSTRCKQYGHDPATYKPVGILQRHGEAGRIRFGLVTGSYKANLKGGVLRKEASLVGSNVNPAHDEINITTGQFNNIAGIIRSINALRIAGYSFSTNNYTDCSTHSIPIATVKSDTRAANRSCSDWGNPLAEIYLETLRYLSGAAGPTAVFNVDDTTAIMSGTTTVFPGVPGLNRVTSWSDPIVADQWCTNCSIILLSTGANSFDGDDLASASDLPGISGADDVADYTDDVGALEYDNFPGSFFAGGLALGERHCTATTLSGLSDAVGICPESPALEGTYAVAGLAYYARTQDLRPDRTGTQTVRTYAVDLAESLPSFKIPVGSGAISFLPACEARPGSGNWQGCSLIDVQVEDLAFSGDVPVSGSYLFYWEDSLWGNDYDIDGAQRIQFCVGPTACSDATVGANQVRITNTVPYAFAGNHLRFSYTITGSAASDGLVSDWAERPGGTNYDALDNPASIPANVGSTVKLFSPGASAATLLKKPLYYAAKYGGFNDLDEDGTPLHSSGDSREWDTHNNFTGEEGPDGIPDTYFSVSNPAQLENSLNQVLTSIIGDVASGSAAAANSTQLSEDTVLYQAKFSSLDWSGELVAYTLDETDGSIEGLKWSTSSPANVINPATRMVFTHNRTNGVNFNVSNWANLHADQRLALGGGSDTLGQNRVNWVRGQNVAGMRERESWLGDIVNSDPVFAGHQDNRFQRLPAALGGLEYQNYMNGLGSYTSAKKDRRQVIYANANDGMLHAFDAETGRELFAYIPSMVYDKFPVLSAPNYGTGANPHQYVVDGPLFVGDAYINNQWRNLLVGTLGAGGRGIFVLDVTDPDAVTANNLVLFELTPANFPQLGHVLGRPIIAPVGNRWKLIFGNGYNSTGGNAHLFVVDLQTPFATTGPNRTRVIPTTADAISNGLAEPSLLMDASRVVTSAYAGDLGGNMWKFDLSGNNAGGWSMAYRLYTARDAAGNPQPISSAPVLGLNDQLPGSTMVYFGTGKYFDAADNDPSTTIHSVYALADQGATIGNLAELDRTVDLHQKVITSQAGGRRTVSGERITVDGMVVSAMDWAAHDGWFLDLVAPDNVPRGERVISKPLLAFDKLIFPTLIPSTASCEFGGSSWLMELVAVGDRYLNHSILDPDGAGIELENAVLGLSNLIRKGTQGYLPISDITGDLTVEGVELPPQSFGRQSWRQLR